MMARIFEEELPVRALGAGKAGRAVWCLLPCEAYRACSISQSALIAAPILPRLLLLLRRPAVTGLHPSGARDWKPLPQRAPRHAAAAAGHPAFVLLQPQVSS